MMSCDVPRIEISGCLRSCYPIQRFETLSFGLSPDILGFIKTISKILVPLGDELRAAEAPNRGAD